MLKIHTYCSPLPPQYSVFESAFISLFLPLPETFLEVLHEYILLQCHGCLDVWNQYKRFIFHVHFEFGEVVQLAQ